MFSKIWKNLKGKSREFAAALVLGMVLCSCSSGAGKSVVLEDVPSGKGAGAIWQRGGYCTDGGSGNARGYRRAGRNFGGGG